MNNNIEHFKRPMKAEMRSHNVQSVPIIRPKYGSGQYLHLYDKLPTSLDALCDLIQRQLIHPWSGKPQPKNRQYTPQKNITVATMLEQLIELNPAGLVMSRTLDQCVIGACRENALLLTSILRYQGVPARMRAGWAKYISSKPDQFADHWVVEVWHEAENRWMWVDSDPKKIDFAPNEFQAAGDAWLDIRQQRASPETYRAKTDLFYVKLNLGHDFNTILGTGPHYWEAPPLFHIPLDQMGKRHLHLVDQVATLLKAPDQNLAKLQNLQSKEPLLQGLESAWPVFAKTVYG
ncbi:MAG: transglutaminase-like domain-containing protein [Chloroflexota bacterium]